MKGFARLLAAEMRKYAHTSVLKIHLVLPLVGMAVIIAVCSGIFMKLTDKDNT